MLLTAKVNYMGFKGKIIHMLATLSSQSSHMEATRAHILAVELRH